MEQLLRINNKVKSNEKISITNSIFFLIEIYTTIFTFIKKQINLGYIYLIS